MIEQIQLKRGLLRLREVTVAELAGHTGVNPATVKSFLHDHLELVEPVRAAPAIGRGRPGTVWKLRPDAEATLLNELEELIRVAGADLEAERNESLLAIKRSIEKLVTAVNELK